MDNLQYFELKLQKYLKDVDFNLYRFRTHCAKFKENMKTSYTATPCPFCLVQPDNQAHSVQCPEVQQRVKIEGNYSEIFKENVPSNISKTLMNITKMREEQKTEKRKYLNNCLYPKMEVLHPMYSEMLSNLTLFSFELGLYIYGAK